MFVGHYAVGFALKKKARDIPLWLLFVSVQFVDILAFLFVLLGVEKIAYNPSPNPFLRTTIDYVPFSHSLAANVVLAVAVFLVFRKLKSKEWAIVLSAAVLSHWFFDALVHAADMPLIHNEIKVGLGLWKFPWIALFFEVSLLFLAGYYLLKNYTKMKRHSILIFLLSAGILSMFLMPEEETSPETASIVSLALYGLFASLAYWSEREIEQ